MKQKLPFTERSLSANFIVKILLSYQTRDANTLRPYAVAVAEGSTLLADDHGLHVAGHVAVTISVRQAV